MIINYENILYNRSENTLHQSNQLGRTFHALTFVSRVGDPQLSSSSCSRLFLPTPLSLSLCNWRHRRLHSEVAAQGSLLRAVLFSFRAGSVLAFRTADGPRLRITGVPFRGSPARRRSSPGGGAGRRRRRLASALRRWML